MFHHIPFGVVVCIQIICAYFFWLAYGTIAFFLGPLRTWSIILALVLWWICNNLNECSFRFVPFPFFVSIWNFRKFYCESPLLITVLLKHFMPQIDILFQLLFALELFKVFFYFYFSHPLLILLKVTNYCLTIFFNGTFWLFCREASKIWGKRRSENHTEENTCNLWGSIG